MILAVTGATGFVGSHLVDRALAGGHQVRALTRRPQPARTGVTWVAGALDLPETLATLVEGSDAVIHVAGVVNARDRAGFAAGNIAGTAAMVAAAIGAGVGRFVHVSSLAAREPALSSYGWSKAGAEGEVTRSPLPAWTIVRPPAVYGPGDLEMRDTFRMARLGIALTPPGGRMSVAHVDDLARLLLTLAAKDDHGSIFEPDDGKPGGWTHAEFFGQAIGMAVGKRVTAIALPRPLLALAARADGLLRGAGAKLTPDRVGYICHPDWVSDPAKSPPADLWRPQIGTTEGLAQTAAWYRAEGLL